ncbi:MAG: glycine cleavage system protein GcvH [Clostridiales bacterium]|nr:glycine cleavage system protein GcvH [Clostridiales bacterium]
MSKLVFANTHEWAKIEDNVATIGISDHAQHELGDLVFINLPAVGDTLTAGKAFCDVESVKAVSDVMAPISGKVIEVNEELESAPEAINEDAMGAWICKVEVTAVPDDLMDEAAYAEFIK